MTEMNDGRPVVFVSQTGDEKISCYDLDHASGALTLLASSDSHGPTGALFLHPSGDVVYAAHVESTTLASFRVDASSGELILIDKVDTGIATPAHLSTDRSGRFLMTAYYGGGGATVHRLGDDGSIQELVQRVETGPKAHAILTDASNRFVIVPHVCPTDTTFQFRFDGETGQLTPNDPPQLAPPEGESGPRHICFRPQGDVAYIINEQGESATAHRFDTDRGTLEIFQHLSTLPSDCEDEGGHCAHIEVHPSGRWVYGSNRGHDSIVGFNVATDGSLSPFGHFPVPSSPRSFNVDPTGTFLYCAGESAHEMRSFRVDAKTGELSALEDYDVGRQPFWVMATTLS